MRLTISRLHWLVVALVAAALSIYGLRITFSSSEAVPVGDSLWQLSISVTLKQATTDNALYVAIPSDDAHMRVVGQSLQFPDFRLKRITQLDNGSRRLVVAPLAASNNIVFNSDFDLQLSRQKRQRNWLQNKTLTAQELDAYLDRSVDEKNSLLFEKINSFRTEAKSPKQILDNIYNYVHNKIVYDPGAPEKSELKILETGRGDELGKAKLMILFARQMAIPARLVSGVIVKEQFDLQQHYWVDAYVDNQWHAYDPTLGIAGGLPANYVRLIYEKSSIAHLADGTPVDVVLDAVQQPALAGRISSGHKRLLDIVDLTRLSLDDQFLLISILLLPVGALLTTLFRTLVGVRTYGSFTPSLIAVAIMHSEWFTVSVLAAIVLGIGFASRSVLPQKITKVPRLSMIFTIVAIAMVLAVSVMEYAGLNANAKVVLLPIIVLTNFVDRFYSTQDESGWFVAIYRAIWTVIVTLCCLLFFSLSGLQYSVLNYPESLLLILAIIMMLGEYKFKKLSDFSNFEWIKEPKKESKNESQKESQKVPEHESSQDGDKDGNSENSQPIAQEEPVDPFADKSKIRHDLD